MLDREVYEQALELMETTQQIDISGPLVEAMMVLDTLALVVMNLLALVLMSIVQQKASL